MSDNRADLMIKARWVAAVGPGDDVLEDHSLVINGEHIADLLPTPLAERKWHATETLTLNRHLLIPGLINAHTHAAMSLLRGFADDLPLMTWLEQHIWPAEQRWLSEAFVLDGARLAAGEMIRSGTTCFADMYFHPDATARVAAEAGLRAVLCCPILDFPTAAGEGPEDYLGTATAMIDNWRHEPRLTLGFGPHAPYTISDGPLARILTLAEELDAPIMMHLHETAGEIQQAAAASGERPLARLARLGLLSPRLLAVHMTQLIDDEIQMLARTGTPVAHCPESNLKLASGFAPVQRLLEAGVNVALGTDGAASNNDLDMIGEMRTAALLAKGVSLRADAVPAPTALRMATLNGARALGLEAQTGSLEVGKQADVVAVDFGALATRPVYDPVAQLVYSASRDQVSHSWVAGRCLMAERRLTTLNPALLSKTADEWQQRISGMNTTNGELQ